MSVRINIIAAVADNLALGNKGGLLWHISEDLKWFKRVTMGCPVLMGRKTFDSLGRPLPGRLNVVITRNPSAAFPEGVVVAGSLEEAVRVADERTASGSVAAGGEENGVVEDVKEVFVIGGGEIYRQALPFADKLYVTRVHTVPSEADTYFPKLDPAEWTRVEGGEVQHDEDSGLDFEFGVYVRK